MIYVALILMCILFIEAFSWLGTMSHIRSVISNSQKAIASILSKDMSDVEKEKAARENSLVILKDTLLFAMKLSIAASMVLIPSIAIFQFTDISPDYFANLIISWSVVIVLSIFSIVYIKIRYGYFQ
jgi:hypothetical protein